MVLSGVAQRQSVDIVVVGDASTGKTSLITTLVSSIFPEAVPKVLQQVRVPPEETADHIALSITDTSSAEQDRLTTFRQVALADVVVLVYAVDKDETFQRVRLHWLPEIIKVFKGPIVVVGNKTDLAKSGKSDDLGDELRRRAEPLLDEYRQIDACWECSAKLNINVSDVFSLAQQAVVYPIAPLFDTKSHELLPKFETALKRVFRFFDQDRDGLLSDVELNDFQETCFGARLQPSDIEDVKTMLQNDGSNYVTPSGITFGGYLNIHRKFLEKNRAETSWLVLRQFGYDDELDLQVPLSTLELGDSGTSAIIESGIRDRSLELSSEARMFFSDIFHQFDEDKDQALCPDELAKLFETCPGGSAPWEIYTYFAQLQQQQEADAYEPKTSTRVKSAQLLRVEEILADLNLGPSNSALCDISDFPQGIRVDFNGNITLAGWLAEWSLITLLQPRLTLLYLYFLGFDCSKDDTVIFTRSRAIESRSNDLQRDVVRAFVFGANGVGKSTFLDTLVYPSGGNQNADSQGELGTGMKVSPSAWTFASGFNGVDISEKKALSRNVITKVRNTRMPASNKSGAELLYESKESTEKLPSAAKYFVLTKVGSEHETLEEAYANGMVDCDIAILLFDSTNPSSVDWLRGVQKRIPEYIPCVYLATKIDLIPSGKDGSPSSDAIEEANMLCISNSLPLPEPISLSPVARGKNRQRLSRLFENLLSVALRPDTARPISEEKRNAQWRGRVLRATMRISLVLGISVATGALLWSWLRPHASAQGSKKDIRSIDR